MVFQVRHQNKIYGAASRNIAEIFGLRERMHVVLLTMGLGHELQLGKLSSPLANPCYISFMLAVNRVSAQ